MSLPRYPEYRPSGVAWIGDVPRNWDVVPLKRRFLLLTEKAESHVNPVALENVEGWSGRYVPSEGEFEGDGTKFDAGDVLFGKLRPYLAKVFLASMSGEAVGDFHVLRPIGEVNPRFAQYQMLRREFIDIVNSSTFGSKMPRASWGDLGALAFVLPSSNEQVKIAEFLDRETAKIDALVVEQEKLIALLKEKRQAVISHAVTKGLNPDAPMKPSGIEWLGDVPAHWSIVPVKHMARMESGHTPDKKVAEYWDGGTIPWVSLNDTGFLRDNDYIGETAYQITQAGIENSSARLLPAGVVVFSRDATIGRCAITTKPMAVSQHFIAWICGEALLPEYLLQVFRSMGQELDRRATGATLKTIGMPDVRELVTPLPPIAEQKRIVERVLEDVQRLDALLIEAGNAVGLLQERRSALISAAVTGQIDVRSLAA